jgi:hypothetical protein
VQPRSLVAAALIAAALALVGNSATAADQGIVVATSVEQTRTIDPAMVGQLPVIEQKVSFLTGHGPEQATYTGALPGPCSNTQKCWAAIVGRACAVLSW